MTVTKFPVNPDKPLLAQLCNLPAKTNVNLQLTRSLNDEELKVFQNELDIVMGQVANIRHTLGMVTLPWMHNAFKNYHLINVLPTVDQIPKTTKKKALVVGNGPSLDKIHDLNLDDYEIFAAWHATPRIKHPIDYVVHIDRKEPMNFKSPDLRGFSFILEPTAAPEFFDLFVKTKEAKGYIYFNSENFIDSILAGVLDKPLLRPNCGTVATACINSAIYAGHTDITLIGVDLGDYPEGEFQPLPLYKDYKMALEWFPKHFKEIAFGQVSQTALEGYKQQEN
jgi:hypothetical protein